MSEALEAVAGVHAVEACLASDPQRMQVLWVQDNRRGGRVAGILQQAGAAGITVKAVSRRELDQRWPGLRHQGLVAECSPRPRLSEKDLEADLAGLACPFLLVLDGVQDPRNLGACMRTALAAGVHGVVIPRDRAAGLTPVASKAAAGAAEVLPLYEVTNLARALRMMRDRGVFVTGAEAGASASLYEADLGGSLALVLGSEEKGLRRLTRELCDQHVHIPLATGSESLNVSVAAGVCLFEAVRQRSDV